MKKYAPAQTGHKKLAKATARKKSNDGPGIPFAEPIRDLLRAAPVPIEPMPLAYLQVVIESARVRRTFLPKRVLASVQSRRPKLPRKPASQTSPAVPRRAA